MLAQRYEFYVLVGRTISHSFAALTREILFLPVEHKILILIFSPPCNILYLLYRHEWFTGKYTTRKIHKDYIRDPSALFSIISHVSLSKSSAIFRHLRKFSEIFGKCSETFVRKSSENQQKRRHQHVFTVEPRFNEVTGDRPNLFVKWRVRYIENLDIRNLTGNDQKVRYAEVIVND